MYINVEKVQSSIMTLMITSRLKEKEQKLKLKNHNNEMAKHSSYTSLAK